MEEVKTTVEKELDKQTEKFNESIYKLNTLSLKVKALYLNNLSEQLKIKYKQKYKLESNKIKEKNQNNFISIFNQIRKIIKTYKEDEVKVKLTDDDYGKYKILSENPDEESELGGSKVKESPIFGPIKFFWRISLINAEFFKINENDKKILNSLIDIIFIPIKGKFPNFKLEFHFERNDFFYNEIISKEYDYKDFDEEELENTYSSEIDWKDESLNSTIKISKKKIKRKGKAKEIQIIKKDVPSFFTIFQKEKNNLNKDLIEANFFKKDFLPNVLEYFLDIMEINYNEIESSESESDES
jgi:hypothetical protein